jgi:hypothetical protein
MAGMCWVRVLDGREAAAGEVWFERGAATGCVLVAGGPKLTDRGVLDAGPGPLSRSGRFAFDADPDGPPLAVLLARTGDGSLLFRWLAGRVRDAVAAPVGLRVCLPPWCVGEAARAAGAWGVDEAAVGLLARRLGVGQGG